MVAKIGEIRAFALNFAPKGWLECDGKEYNGRRDPYAHLFNTIGTAYGGTGNPNFNVPDLRGRVLMGAGQGYGLIARHLGEMPGEELVKLTLDDLPSHQHRARARNVVGSTAGMHGTPQPGDHIGRLFASPSEFGASYCANRMFPNGMHGAMIGIGGGGHGHENRQPYLPVTYCIAYEGSV